MAGRQLGPEERALWRRVTEDVRALERPRPAPVSVTVITAPPPQPAPLRRIGRVPPPLPPRIVAKAATPADTLDGGWDRRLRRGMVSPDRTIDLHGHTLATAHAALEAELGAALMADARLILLVTGRPPRERGSGDGHKRGAIRATVGDWLVGSAYASRIAAVRNAHPRHGGAGALYVILRRRREVR